MRVDRGERKKYKIINRSATVSVHICTGTEQLAFIHKFAQTDVGLFFAHIV